MNKAIDIPTNKRTERFVIVVRHSLRLPWQRDALTLHNMASAVHLEIVGLLNKHNFQIAKSIAEVKFLDADHFACWRG